ncbi:MAG: 50S ribosomal protein L10, partial [Spirochaetia bacterium]|nr:50S ribosomal protein L10 [Spirochaetia bacterium]
DKISIKGGYFEGKFVDAAFVKKMANIPPRDVLLAHLVGSLMGPISNLVFTLQAIAQKKEAGTPAETAPTT